MRTKSSLHDRPRKSGANGTNPYRKAALQLSAPAALAALVFALVLPVTARAQEPAPPPFPAEISLGDGLREDSPVSIDDVIAIAVEQSRSLKSSVNTYESSLQKVSETKKQFGLNAKVEANYQRVHDPTSFSMPYTYYDVAPIYIPGVLPLPFNPPENLQDESMYIVTDPVPNIGFRSAEINQDWQHGAELKISKPLLTFGKKEKAVDAATYDSRVKKLDVKLERMKLLYNVKEAFYNVLLAKKNIDAQKESVARSVAHVDAANSRFDTGVVPKLDVIRARSDLEQSKETLIQAHKGYDLAVMNLNNIIGLPVGRKTILDEDTAYKRIELKELDFYNKLAFETRPELNQIDLAQDAAALAAELEEKKALFSFAGTWTFHNRGSTFASEDSWRAIIAGEIPLFDDGLASAKKAQALKQHENLMLSETDLREGILLQVKSAYLDVIEADQRIESSDVILEIAEEAYRMADLGFKEGVTAQIDLIDAEHTLTQARLGHAKAAFDYEVSKARLAYSCGVDSLEDYIND